MKRNIKEDLMCLKIMERLFGEVKESKKKLIFHTFIWQQSEKIKRNPLLTNALLSSSPQERNKWSNNREALKTETPFPIFLHIFFQFSMCFKAFHLFFKPSSALFYLSTQTNTSDCVLHLKTAIVGLFRLIDGNVQKQNHEK